MSKTESQARSVSRLSAGFAAGIVVIFALTATVIGVELYGLNGITGKVVRHASNNWSSSGPNATFAANMFYRDGELRKFAKLELASGHDGAAKAVAQKLISAVDGFDSRIATIIKDQGINAGQLQVSSPNLYADYATVYQTFQQGNPATIDARFKHELAALEKRASLQLQSDAGRVGDKKLKLVATDVQAHNMSLASELNRP